MLLISSKQNAALVGSVLVSGNVLPPWLDHFWHARSAAVYCRRAI